MSVNFADDIGLINLVKLRAVAAYRRPTKLDYNLKSIIILFVLTQTTKFTCGYNAYHSKGFSRNLVRPYMNVARTSRWMKYLSMSNKLIKLSTMSEH